MPLWLDKSAHHAKRTDGLAVFRQEAGNDRMIGALPRRQRIGVAGLQRKIAAPVVQGDAGFRHDQAGTKSHVVALDIGNHIAFSVGGRQIYGTAFDRLAGGRLQCRFADHLPPFGCIRFRQQLLHRHVAPARVGNVFQSVGKRQLDCFDVQVVGIRRLFTLELHSLQDVQRQ